MINEKIESLYGRIIKQISHYDDNITIECDNGDIIELTDPKSCCESRYFVVEDDTSYYAGAKLVGISIGNHTDVEGDYNHEISFLDIRTDKGVLSVCAHNEHNGYYGGFGINVSLNGNGLGYVDWSCNVFRVTVYDDIREPAIVHDGGEYGVEWVIDMGIDKWMGLHAEHLTQSSHVSIKVERDDKAVDATLEVVAGEDDGFDGKPLLGLRAHPQWIRHVEGYYDARD